jgi:hypothetical protein
MAKLMQILDEMLRQVNPFASHINEWMKEKLNNN